MPSQLWVGCLAGALGDYEYAAKLASCSSSIEVDWVADRLFDTKLLLPLSPGSGSASLAAMKSRGECVGRAIPDKPGEADRERHRGQRCARPNDDIERVTGRPARPFEDFVRRNAAAWAPASPKVPIAT